MGADEERGVSSKRGLPGRGRGSGGPRGRQLAQHAMELAFRNAGGELSVVGKDALFKHGELRAGLQLLNLVPLHGEVAHDITVEDDLVPNGADELTGETITVDEDQGVGRRLRAVFFTGSGRVVSRCVARCGDKWSQDDEQGCPEAPACEARRTKRADHSGRKLRAKSRSEEPKLRSCCLIVTERKAAEISIRYGVPIRIPGESRGGVV